MDKYHEAIEKMTPEEYWQRLVECGWVDEVHEDLRSALKESVHQKFLQDRMNTWEALVTITEDAEVMSDSEDDHIYTVFLNRLAEHSSSIFHPETVTAEYIGDQLMVRFSTDGRVYEFETFAESDYIDPGILSVVNRALADGEVNKAFVLFPAVDQVLYMAFIPPAIYQKAEELMLVPPQDYFM